MLPGHDQSLHFKKTVQHFVWAHCFGESGPRVTGAFLECYADTRACGISKGSSGPGGSWQFPVLR